MVKINMENIAKMVKELEKIILEDNNKDPKILQDIGEIPDDIETLYYKFSSVPRMIYENDENVKSMEDVFEAMQRAFLSTSLTQNPAQDQALEDEFKTKLLKILIDLNTLFDLEKSLQYFAYLCRDEIVYSFFKRVYDNNFITFRSKG